MLSIRTFHVLLAGAVFFSCAAIACEGRDNPVALVNDSAIYREDLDSFVSVMRFCNADLDGALEEKNGTLRAQLEREMLQILIDFELVRQEMERLSLQVDELTLQEKTAQLIDDLLETRFLGSDEALQRRCKELRLTLEDLAIIPLYELKLVTLFDYVAGSITEDNVLFYVEENPELLFQEEAFELYQVVFGDMAAAQSFLEKLEEGAELEQLAGRTGDNSTDIRFNHHGWITREYPFLEKPVIEALFAVPQAARGWITEEGVHFKLYWIAAYRPDTVLEFKDIREEATMRARYVLYQDYFNTLWSKSKIEIRQ